MQTQGLCLGERPRNGNAPSLWIPSDYRENDDREWTVVAKPECNISRKGTFPRGYAVYAYIDGIIDRYINTWVSSSSKPAYLVYDYTIFRKSAV